MTATAKPAAAKPAAAKPADWTKPAAMAIPKEGFFKLEQGRYGPIFPKTPACYGFSVVAKVKPGKEQAIREYGKNIEEAVKGDSSVLATLKLHYLRWVLFDVGSGLQDRKSTRLNSSHLGISYAVFCLKKKNI